MANHASALKAHRQSVKHRDRNRSSRSGLRTHLKQFSDQLETVKGDEAKKALSELYSVVDKSRKKKAVSRNAANRKKSRLAKRLNASLAASTQAS